MSLLRYLLALAIVLGPIAHGVFAATVSSMIGPARTRPLTPVPGEVLIQTLLDGAGDDDVGGPDRGS